MDCNPPSVTPTQPKWPAVSGLMGFKFFTKVSKTEKDLHVHKTVDAWKEAGLCKAVDVKPKTSNTRWQQHSHDKIKWGQEVFRNQQLET
eukprot:1276589-Rhodomonas_salina.1